MGQTEDRRRLAMENANSFTFERDLATGKFEFDEAAYSLYGFPQDADLTTEMLYGRVVDAEDGERMKSLLEHALTLEHPTTWEVEYEFRRGDGQLRWFVSKSMTCFDNGSAGGPTRVIGLITDITEHRRRLHAQRLLNNASRILSSSLDLHETLSKIVNIAVPSFADMCSVDLLESGGRLERAVVAHRDPARRDTLMRTSTGMPLPETHLLNEVLTTSRPLLVREITGEMVNRLVRSEEQRQYVDELDARSMVLVPLVSKGAVLGTVQFAISDSVRRYDEFDLDIAEELGRRCGTAVDNARLHSNLQASELRFRETFENAGVGITITDVDGRLMRMNRRFCEIVGYGEQELLGKDVADITYLPDRKPFPQVRALRRGEVLFAEIEKRYVHRDGHIVWAKVTASMPRDEEGRPLHRTNVVEDISDRKRAEMRLAAEHAVSRVIANGGSLMEAAPQLLDALCRSLDMDIVELWLPDEDGDSLQCAGMRNSDSFTGYRRWQDLTRDVRFHVGEALPGKVWSRGSPQYYLDVNTAPDSPRREAALALGLESAMAFPLMAGEHCMGVICLHTRQKLSEDDQFEATLTSLGRDIAQFMLREQAEGALRRSEDRYRAIVESMAELVCRFQPDGKILFVNDAYAQARGTTPDQLTGVPFWDFIEARDRDGVREMLALLSPEMPEVRIENRFETSEGLRWFLWTNRALAFDDSGRPTEVQSAGVDITARKQAEEELRQAHGLIEGITRGTDDLIAAVDNGFRYVYFNDAYRREFRDLWGQPVTVGAGISAALGPWPGEQQKLEELWRRALNGEAFSVTTTFGPSDKAMRVYDLRFNPIYDAAGNLIGAAHILRNVTEQVRMHEALRESEERYRGTFDSAAAGVAHLAMDGAYLRVNSKLCEILGYTESELLCRTCKSITYPDDMAADSEDTDQLLSGEALERTAEKRYIRGDGTLVWVTMTRSLVKKPDGTPDYFIAVIFDTSKQKELEDNLRQSNAMLEQRVQERTADLEGLTASLRLLAARLTRVEQSERRRLAEMIHDDLQQLLVAARMQVSGLQATGSGMTLDQARGLAVSLLDQAIEEARSLTAQLRPPALYESGLGASLRWLAGWMEQVHGFKVSLDLGTVLHPVPEGDSVLLFDSVRELLLNAVKHSGTKEARVKMSWTKEKCLSLTVSDRGEGFDVSKLNTPRTDTGGFGLFSIRERVISMGGRFTVKSAPDTGTTVNLLWPVVESAQPAFDRPEGVKRDAGTAGRRDGVSAAARKTGHITVLLVDDHALVRQSLAEVLDQQADILVVSEAADGEEAVRNADMFRPQVVVMDVNMPKLNGIQACRVIKERFPEIQVVGVSIHNDAGTREAMLNAGAFEYLSKDGPVEGLIDAIRRHAVPSS